MQNTPTAEVTAQPRSDSATGSSAQDEASNPSRHSMRSAEITADGRVEVVERPVPSGRLGSRDLRVRMLAVGICGTDHSLASGRRTPPELPWRLGHEGFGEVIEVGSDIQGIIPGDRVTLEPNITCGKCDYCIIGRTSACSGRRSAGVLTQPGFLTEVVDHPSAFCHRVGPEVPVERAVCTEPLTVAAAAIRRSELSGDETVLVIGAGAQGLLSIIILTTQGYRPLVSEPDDERRALAVELGAQVFEPGTSPAPEVVIDAAGVPEALGSVVDHLAPFAKVTIVGEDNHHLGASSFDIVQKQLRIQGSFIYEHPQDMAHAVSLLSIVPTEAIMGPAIGFDDVPSLFAEPTANRVGVKQWVDMRR